MSIRDKCAIVGVGAPDYCERGQSYPETELSMACTAILAALTFFPALLLGPIVQSLTPELF